jgi:hypothetical protein
MFSIFDKLIRPKQSKKPVYRQNTRPDNTQYKIVLGKDLKVGDIVVHKNERVLLTSVSEGGGSGSFDFGTYVPIKAEKLTGQEGYLTVDFWTFVDCPTIVEYVV